MDDRDRLDDELADLTDALLERREMQMTDASHRLDEVVQQLYQLIQPDSPPSPAFRDRLTQRLNDEWNMTMQQRPQRHRSSFYMPPRTRLLAAAAAVVVALGVLAIYLNLQPQGNEVTGTTVGTPNWGVITIVAIVGGVVLFVLWRRNR